MYGGHILGLVASVQKTCCSTSLWRTDCCSDPSSCSSSNSTHISVNAALKAIRQAPCCGCAEMEGLTQALDVASVTNDQVHNAAGVARVVLHGHHIISSTAAGGWDQLSQAGLVCMGCQSQEHRAPHIAWSQACLNLPGVRAKASIKSFKQQASMHKASEQVGPYKDGVAALISVEVPAGVSSLSAGMRGMTSHYYPTFQAEGSRQRSGWQSTQYAWQRLSG